MRQLIGVTGQFASVDENLTGAENLWMFGRLQGLRSKEAHRIADELLAQFDLTEAAHRPISQFSGGMRRRLDLAASLITRPALIFLDEPTTGLDPRNRSQMWDTIRDLVARGIDHPVDHPVPRRGRRPGRTDRRHRSRSEGRRGHPRPAKTQIGTSSLRVQMAAAADTAAAVALAADLTGDTPVVSPTGSGFSVTLSDANQAGDVLVALRNHRLRHHQRHRRATEPRRRVLRPHRPPDAEARPPRPRRAHS